MVRKIFFLIFLLFAFNLFPDERKVVYIPEKELPKRIVVLPPICIGDVKLDPKLSKIMRRTTQNFLVGKGYINLSDKAVPGLKDIKLKPFNPKKIAEKLSPADGFFAIFVHGVTQMNLLLFKRFKLDAELCMFNKEGKKMGCWRECVSRKKADIATDPLGLALKALSNVILCDPTLVLMRNLVFDWTYQVSALVPGFSAASKKPKILRVVTNITEKVFKEGDKIVVVMEGDPGMEASFDIGTFKRNLKMVETEKPGIYQGFYVVQKGDEARNQYLLARLVNQQGEEREWLEIEPLINIDGIPPKPPENLKGRAVKGAIKLSWNLSDTTTREFLILRSEEPLSGYVEISRVKDISFEDRDIKPGKTYFYRVAAIDAVGNISEFSQIGPIIVPIEKGEIGGALSESLVKGSYLVKEDLIIPSGSEIHIGPESTLTFSSNASLIVKGKLYVRKSILKPIEKMWRGIRIPLGGILNLEDSKIIGANGTSIDGFLSAKNTVFYNGEGFKVNDMGKLILDSCELKNLGRAVLVKGGKLNIERSKIVGNKVGIFVEKGDIKISHNNFLENEVDISSRVPITVKANFLGNDPLSFKLNGSIKVLSYLTAPYPEGREKKFSEKEFEEKAKELLRKAKDFIKSGDYGKACKNLELAYKIKKNEEICYLLAFVYTMLGEDGKLSKVIEDSLKSFPYEVKIYQLAIRYYISKGEKEKAKKLLERALKLQPGNPMLEALKPLVE